MNHSLTRRAVLGGSGSLIATAATSAALGVSASAQETNATPSPQANGTPIGDADLQVIDAIPALLATLSNFAVVGLGENHGLQQYHPTHRPQNSKVWRGALGSRQ